MTYMETKLFSWQKMKQIITLIFCQGRYCILRRNISVFFVVAVCQNLMSLKMTIKLGRTLYA